MKILIVFGTRPEAIKMAPVIEVLQKEERFQTKVCVTGQHRHMLDQVLSVFSISPDFDLDLMRTDQDVTDITGLVLVGMRDLLNQWRPDILLVHGDTTTAMATSLAAFYQRIRIGHIEAGLRTGNIYMPWPEEMNRKVIDDLSYLHFAPTVAAKEHLLREGVSPKSIYVTGNTVVDALLGISNRIDNDVEIRNKMQKNFSFLNPAKRLILVTGHRRESFGEGFINVCQALLTLSERNDIQIVYPVHLNPNVQEPVMRILSAAPNIYLIEPQDYLQFVYLMKQSYMILTDSGGVQEEAPALGKPVLVMRDITERPEALAAKTALLVGTNQQQIVLQTNSLLDDAQRYQMMCRAHNPYGDGRTAERIRNILIELEGNI